MLGVSILSSYGKLLEIHCMRFIVVFVRLCRSMSECLEQTVTAAFYFLKSPLFMTIFPRYFTLYNPFSVYKIVKQPINGRLCRSRHLFCERSRSDPRHSRKPFLDDFPAQQAHVKTVREHRFRFGPEFNVHLLLIHTRTHTQYISCSASISATHPCQSVTLTQLDIHTLTHALCQSHTMDWTAWG
jgi:hypothetical protein